MFIRVHSWQKYIQHFAEYACRNCFNIFAASIVVNIFSTGLVIRERGRLYKSALADLSDDENVRGMSRETRRSVYERSLHPEAMERAGKLSSGSIRVERQIEAIRGDAYAALRSIPEYRALKPSDQKVVRDLVNEELERFNAKAASMNRRGEIKKGKQARVPDWTPADLAKAALEARQ